MIKKSFPVVILAGGLATRLYPVTQTIPKSLILINGQPFIDHQLQLLRQHGIQKVVLCIGYLGEMIEQHLGNGHQFDMEIHYSYDGPTLLGTAGAIKKAQTFLSEPFFVLYGDSFLNCHYAAIQNAFMQQKKLGLMTVFHNAGKWDTSNVDYQAGKIVAYDKVNRTHNMQYIDYGLGILTPEALNAVPENKFYDLALLYQDLLNRDELGAFEVTERFYEVGSFAGIKELESYLESAKGVLA